MIGSKVEYSSPAFLKAFKDEVLAIFKTVQNAKLGTLPSSPTDSIYCETDELPPEFKLSLVTNRFLVLATMNPSNPVEKVIINHPIKYPSSLDVESLVFTTFLKIALIDL